MTDRKAARANGEETRRRNAEIRKAARAEQWEQERQDRVIVAAAMRGILMNPEATTRERVFAALTLDSATSGNVVPWRATRLYDSDVDIAAFKEAVDAITKAKK